jgi:hypothetical protein
MMTNSQVLGSKLDAAQSELIFDFQLDRRGTPMAIRSIALMPDERFVTDPALDFTLVAVAEKAKDGGPLSAYGWNKLCGEEGKAIKGDPVNIIQHPMGQPKQLVLRSNRVVALPDNPPYIHYETDTEPGSSGSPAHNYQWEVIALHHAGVPGLDANDEPVRDAQGSVRWVANEGIRVSRLVKAITELGLTGRAAALRDAMMTATPPDLLDLAHARAVPRVAPPTTNSGVVLAPGGSAVSLTIPLTITVSLGDAGTAGSPVAMSAPVVGVTDIAQPTGDRIVVLPPTAPGPTEALALLEKNRDRVYLDAAANDSATREYYKLIDPTVAEEPFYRALATLVTATHAKRPRYAPARELYPWIDLVQVKPEPMVNSIYSGRLFRAADVIPEELVLESRREALEAQARLESTRPSERAVLEREVAALEARRRSTASTSCRNRGFARRSRCAATCTTSSPSSRTATASAETHATSTSAMSRRPCATNADGARPARGQRYTASSRKPARALWRARRSTSCCVILARSRISSSTRGVLRSRCAGTERIRRTSTSSIATRRSSRCRAIATLSSISPNGPNGWTSRGGSRLAGC